ncbi:group II truncated hemoglobin [Plastoroseomonas arctica]|uniref:Globin n=1 Tax=Plastoroseomonas arctica TaxID=1509237 RepID=A0AAF1KLM1_9PROT|nr:group II truncated hemoglobin [Plastoroseomonas arctica]MBR0654896.1 globin [Plastoroseomonas arctica]
MSDAAPVPSLVEWAGGPPAFHALAERFYAKVPQDALLAPIFASMNPEHAHHVADFVAEVFGDPARPYSAAGGSHAKMIAHHLGRHLTEAQRKRWITLMLETVDEAGLPDDPEFRAALVGYLEWATRLAVLNSQPGVVAPQPDMAMPVWGWGPPGGPYRGPA